ncbi:MAG: 1-deoxy-D-xylulose-5-phosphate reductoisomerase [Victivallaceae bacterium]|nr:1-deoxy-D-xylulose-5-phosphate reductoisomerase [Victivallaceae bacterium]
MKKNVVILGSTGSVGCNAVEVALSLSDRINVSAIAAGGNNIQLLAEQGRQLACDRIVTADPNTLVELRSTVSGLDIGAGAAAVIDLVTEPQVDLVVSAIVGSDSLLPVLNAVKAGKDIALASKEVMVMAGELIMREAEKSGANIIPLDSEHSAIFQCLVGQKKNEVAKLILTASGGPFLNASDDEIKRATYKQALAHPTWDMGPKNTIDSATLMNKALEVIEAKYLFDVAPETIEVIIHPQSVIHSMIEFVDGAMLAQLSVPDMRFPIQYAYTWPERAPGIMERMDFLKYPELTFKLPDRKRFSALDLADAALHVGGTMPTVLNAANEVAVELFSQHKIKFYQIWAIVEGTMAKHQAQQNPALDEILAAGTWAARIAATVL